MNGRVCGALVQFGCYQHQHKWMSSSPIYIRLSLEVTWVCLAVYHVSCYIPQAHLYIVVKRCHFMAFSRNVCVLYGFHWFWWHLLTPLPSSFLSELLMHGQINEREWLLSRRLVCKSSSSTDSSLASWSYNIILNCQFHFVPWIY